MNIANDQDTFLAGWMRGLLIAALGLSIGAFLINQVYDLDVWWQVAIGRDILAQGAVPTVDRFAAAAIGRPYHDSHWVFQVLLAVADRIGGMTGVQMVMITIWSAILVCVYRASSRWIPAVWWVPLLFLSAMASTERFLPRPELITFLGLAFFYWRLQEGRYRTWCDLILLLLMQWVWTNGHGLFVIGPFLVGCYWLVAGLGKGESVREALPALTRLMAMVLGVTLLTPYGWGSWRYALLLFQEAGPQAPKLLKSVGELSPTFGAANMNGVAFWFFLVLLLITVVLVGWVSLRKQSISIARLLIVMAMLAAALTGRRNMVLFALVAVPFAAEQLQVLIPRPQRFTRVLAGATTILMIVWSWYPLSGSYYVRMELPSRFGIGATPSFFPHGLPGFLTKIGYQGQVFNSNTLGGFYLYHGYPTRVSYTDGRWEIYTSATFDEIRDSLRHPGVWQMFAERHGVNGILLQHTSSEAKLLLPLLKENPRWRLIYLDAAASFWVGADAYFTVPTISLRATTSLPEVSRLDDCLILDRFYQQMAVDPLRAKNLERALGFGRNTETLLANLGATLQKAGDYDEAQKVFERLHRDYPRNCSALNELAFLAYRRGDLLQAEEFLRQALELEPDNPDAQANYQRVRNSRQPGRD